ncbi:SDR family NAD(P)-dependent oxidoreductase [Embleya hyalina]|uniref:3-alpha-hydroxysteroid dehydrogenase n=1 Tax=Embleya hyalina TaxID=516124 RepID=A0A401YPH7_9ACTN|nr:glucose 1-dehydrogenase [Embleya hyalina]GCD96492.1 3-alpha-hydroxysteroid dehydrogenase [Embleya hyalina]
MSDSIDLTGKVAIVTGAARGQGEAEARLFARRGARVVLTDLLEDEGARVAGEIGPRARFVRHDVSNAADWAAVVELAVREFGPVDVLVNNAGVMWTKPILEETPEGLDRILKVNLFGAFHGIQAVAPLMRANGGGSIVNISSLAGLQGIPGHAAYGSSKWAVRGLTKTAALELGEYGIRVNSVHPGAVDTPMIGDRFTRGPGNFPTVPLRRVGEPEDIGELVAFLASDASSWITGTEFVIDGGSTAGIVPPVRG